MSWIITYDICEPRRLVRIHRLMCQHATPIEYSMFMFEGTRHQLDRCMAELCGEIDASEDDLRCYQLPSRGLQNRIGAPVLPAGIHWTAMPAGWLD